MKISRAVILPPDCTGVYMAILDLWIWKDNLTAMAYREIGRLAGIHSAFSADTRNVVRWEAGRVLETATLVLASRKGDPFFSATSFSWSHDRLVCAE